MICHQFWTLTRKNLEFTGKKWAGISKLNSICPEEHLQTNVSDRNCSKFHGFWLNYEISGTLTNIFLQGCQNRKIFLEEHIKESPFSKGKNLLNFQDSKQTLHFTLAEKFARVVKTVTYVAFEDLEEKKRVWNFAHWFKILWNLRQKNKSFTRKISFRVVTSAIRASTGKFCGKSIFYQTNYVSCLKFGSAAIFFVPWQISYLGEPKQQCTCLEETFGGTLLSKTVFFNCSDFEQRNLDFFWKNKGTFVKTVA